MAEKEKEVPEVEEKPYETLKEYEEKLKGFPKYEWDGIKRKHIAALELFVESQEQKIRDNQEYLRINKRLPEEVIEFRNLEIKRAEDKIADTKRKLKLFK